MNHTFTCSECKWDGLELARHCKDCALRNASSRIWEGSAAYRSKIKPTRRRGLILYQVMKARFKGQLLAMEYARTSQQK